MLYYAMRRLRQSQLTTYFGSFQVDSGERLPRVDKGECASGYNHAAPSICTATRNRSFARPHTSNPFSPPKKNENAASIATCMSYRNLQELVFQHRP